jgi:2-polyprenyl-6-methoxyphenol hydroxylase-like FAD-dependent oxidoreductase
MDCPEKTQQTGIMETRIIIIGGGIAGLTTALALQRKNIDYLIFESVPEIKSVGAGISLAGNAMRVLKRLQVDEEIRRKGEIIHAMLIQDDKGRLLSEVDAEEIKRECGLESVGIHRADLHQVLLTHIPVEKIYTSKKAVDIIYREKGVSILFEDGHYVYGRAVIMADGIHSVIRKKVLPQVMPRYAGYTCWRGMVDNTFHIQHTAVETWGARGRFGYVPIGNGKLYWFACKNAPINDARLRSFTIDDLARNFSTYPDEISQIVKATAPGDLIHNDILDLKPVNQYAFGRLVLIGDAAHATTPNLGQGACLAMEDAFLVAEELDAYREDIAFKNFEMKRMKRTHFIVTSSYRMGKIAQWENPLLTHIRNFIVKNLPAQLNKRQLLKILDA